MITVNSFMLKIRDGFSIDTLFSEDICRDWFLRELHPAGAVCPVCKLAITSRKKLKRFWELRRVTCSGCNRTFSAVTGTVLNGLGIDFRALYILLFMVSHGVHVNNISRQLGISTGAAYAWANKAKGKCLSALDADSLRCVDVAVCQSQNSRL